MTPRRYDAARLGQPGDAADVHGLEQFQYTRSAVTR